jgi:hypothetical protein
MRHRADLVALRAVPYAEFGPLLVRYSEAVGAAAALHQDVPMPALSPTGQRKIKL